MECTSESLGAVLRAFCPCGLVRQALNYILRGVRIGADRVKITLFLRGAEQVHVPTVVTSLHFIVSPLARHWRPFINGGTIHYNPLPVAMHHRAYYILVFTHAHTELLDYRLQAKERTGKGMHPPLGTRLLQYM